MKAKRVLSLVAAVVLAITLIPQVSGPLYAADDETAIVAGTDTLPDGESATELGTDALPDGESATEAGADTLPDGESETGTGTDGLPDSDKSITGGEEEPQAGPSGEISAEEGQTTDEETLSLHNVKVYDPEPIEPISVSPGSINEATDKFVDALQKFTKDTSDLKKIPAILERFGGITSAVSGGIVVLQMCGILKDSTSEALDNILNELHDIEDTLKSMDQKLDDILEKLTKLELELKEDDLANKTNEYQDRWNTFNTNYVEPLQHYYSEYRGYINRGLGAWWDEGTHNGERVLYTEYEGEIVATYALGAYDDGFPSVSGNGETVLVDYSFGLPAEYMIRTTPGTFNVETFSDEFLMAAAEAIFNAANDRNLDATDAFYENWDALSDVEKVEKAAVYAQDLLNTVTNRVSCEVMTNNDDWVIHFRDAYIDYCNNLINPTTGVSSMVKLQCLINPVEYFATQKNDDICDQTIASCGSYGIFLLSVLGQDSYQAPGDKESVQTAWVNAIEGVATIKDSYKTGYGNFCYLTNSLITYHNDLEISSTMTAQYTQSDRRLRRFDDYDSSPWKLTDTDGNNVSAKLLLNEVDATLVYQQAVQSFPDEIPKWNFPYYLWKCGANPIDIPDYRDEANQFMVSCTLNDKFDLKDDCPEMVCDCLYDREDIFSTGEKYLINKGNPSGIKKDNFKIHDRVKATFMDGFSGNFYTDNYFGARALYKDHYWLWEVDRGYVFFKNVDYSHTTHHDKTWIHTTKEYTLKRDVISILTSPVPKNDNAESAILDEIIEICYTNRQHKQEPEPYSAADWSAYSADAVDVYSEDEGKWADGIDTVIEEALERSIEAGNKITLTKEEKTKLTSSLSTQILDLQSELQANKAIVYRDVFGINGNEAAELALAAAVLPGTYLDENGASKITAENMDTQAAYEAGVELSIESKNGGITAVLNPCIHVRPELIIWDPVNEEFLTFEIPSEVMKAQGLTMNVRLSAVSAGKSASVTIRHYDNDRDMDLLEQTDAAIQGSGPDRFAELFVTHCSPFELVLHNTVVLREPNVTPTVTPTTTPTKAPISIPTSTPGKTNTTAAKTGDSNVTDVWILIFAGAMAGLILIFALRRRSFK